MPLLKNKAQPELAVDQPQTHDDTPTRKGSIFSRRHRSTSPTGLQMNSRTSDANANGNAGDHTAQSSSRAGGFFSRRRARSSSDDSISHVSGRSGTGSGLNSSIHGRHSNDPSIISACQAVGEAEEAERQADRALVEARARVREAKEHVKNLEREIEEEARMHKLKQQEAKQVSKSAKGLGRYG